MSGHMKWGDTKQKRPLTPERRAAITLRALDQARTIRERIKEMTPAMTDDDRFDLPYSLLVPPREPVRIGCPVCCSTDLTPASVRDGYYCKEGHLVRLWFEVDGRGVVLEVRVD